MSDELLAILRNAQPAPSPDLEWSLPTTAVAEGFGVSPETVRAHKSNHKDELQQGYHWYSTGRATMWTKPGVVRLGMFINSERAIAFRDAAERFLLGAIEPLKNSTEIAIATVNQILDPLAAAIAKEILARELPERVEVHLEQMLGDRNEVQALLGKLNLPVPRDWGTLFT